ncbi:MAG: hypothetical protein IKO10_02360 [Lachnospiraceae bacterium]|nr:hypothetical protein [Lachnospiraceae bacterium]
MMISGKVLKKGLKKVVAASPILGIAVVSAVITKYILEDIKEKHEKKDHPEAEAKKPDSDDDDWDIF